MKITGQRVVTMHYTLTDVDGQQLDASYEDEPLIYLHGTRSLLAGLEQALEGKTAGDHFKVTVQPEDGYGAINAELVHQVPLSAFEDFNNLTPGMQFELQSEEGQGEQFSVFSIEGDQVTISANHPLAGKVLNFDVSIESVRQATAQEIENGHVLQPE